ncbi:MAG: hypothetical protein ABR499_11580 [Gemmatimonadaceae bacterium]
MRTPRRPQSALRAPLNAILGTEANVRLLRVLALAGTSVAAGELARRAHLGRTSIYPALEGLEAAGIIEFIGAGAQRQVIFRKSHPLGGALAALFRAEAQRFDALISALRDIFERLTPPPTAAWVEGPVLAGKDQPGDAISCYVLSDPQALPLLIDQISDRLGRVEKMFDVRVELHGITRSELDARSPAHLEAMREAILLAGVPPAALGAHATRSRSSRGFESHEDHDARARRLAVAIAAKLKRDPGLTRLARQHLARRGKKASPRERRELQEWARILATMSPGRLQRFLVEPGERATRLRQTLPALGLLTPAERDAVLASTSDAEARAAVLGGRPRRATG